MERIDGKMIAQSIKDEVKNKIENDYISKGKDVPCLACIIVEGNSASEVYVASKEKSCAECGMKSKIVRLPNDVSQEKLENVILELNNDNEVSGILLQLPLPEHLNSDSAINKIDPRKDVDCLTNQNLGELFSATGKIAPCTATGIIKILKYQNVEISGKRAVVIGRSLLVGKSVANLLEQNNATVTICHSRTQNMKEITKQADILVVAIGKTEYIDSEYIKDGAVVIDVGINRTEQGLKGDVNYESACTVCSQITPVPGGVGPLTVACLMENTLILDKLRKGI
ncbi:MAG: bifunctional 5,10-methylenetetrahydrofolate dehydrogenase/5,10-methenyltetrahydrofolate cyclohydrolase [Clostridia bacterium]|nr:bifunctional 5,10-methylenetetrahydrofolate dehydrogenase/5,10-methenyltetrahydrofolate cyclohydrolase [Clostridia bacterium]